MRTNVITPQHVTELPSLKVTVTVYGWTPAPGNCRE